MISLSSLGNLAVSHFSARSSAPWDNMIGAICGMVDPLVGSDSKMLSLVFLLALGAIILLWFLNENKEGLIVWVLRAGLVLGVLINLMTLPPLVGLPSPC